MADSSALDKKLLTEFYGSDELQNEFKTFAVFCAYRRAEAAGRVRLTRSGCIAPDRSEFKPRG